MSKSLWKQFCQPVNNSKTLEKMTLEDSDAALVHNYFLLHNTEK